LVFNKIKERYYRQKELALRLSNLAKTVDNCQIQVSFQAIRSFAKAKVFAFAKRKENSSLWLA
jgi:hypothetical protein